MVEISNKPTSSVTTMILEEIDQFEAYELSKHNASFNAIMSNTSRNINIRAYYLDIDAGNFQQSLLKFTTSHNDAIKSENSFKIYTKNYQNIAFDNRSFYYFMQQLDFFLKQNLVAPPMTINFDLAINPQKISTLLLNQWVPFFVIMNNNNEILFSFRLKISVEETGKKMLSLDVISKSDVLKSKNSSILWSPMLQTNQENSVWMDFLINDTEVNSYNFTITISSKQSIIKAKSKDMVKYKKTYLASTPNYIDDFFKNKNTTKKLIMGANDEPSVLTVNMNYLRLGYENYA